MTRMKSGKPKKKRKVQQPNKDAPNNVLQNQRKVIEAKKPIDLGVILGIDNNPTGDESIIVKLDGQQIWQKVSAISQKRSVSAEDQSAAETLNDKGEQLAAAGQFNDALSYFQQASVKNPNWVVPTNNIGVVYWQTGDQRSGLEWMGKAFKINPDHHETAQNLVEMLTQINRQDSAFVVAQSYLRRHPEDKEIQSLSDELRPPVRIIHHMARSGGTLICKCLGCMNQVLLLSEVHPLGMRWFDPLIQAYEWFNLFTGEEMDEMKADNLSFQEKIIRIYERAMGRNRRLVIRDWSHLDYTGVPFVQNPSYSLTTASILHNRFQVMHLATVRHPIDQWLSLSRLAVMQGHINVETFMNGYRRFAESARQIGFVRYENFTKDPQSVMQTICSTLKLNFDAAFMINWNHYKTITGDTQSERGSDGVIKTMTRRPVDSSLMKQIEECQDYWESLSILGYEHCP